MIGWPDSAAVAADRWAQRVHEGTMTVGTAARYSRTYEAFCRYAIGSGVADATRATTSLCERFATTPTHAWLLPAGSTAGVRLAAIRDAFEGLIAGGLVEQNPTVGVRLGRLTATFRPCPLTPQEAHRLLVAGRLFATDTLRPAGVALALGGATHAEVAGTAIADFDADGRCVSLATGTRAQRTVDLEALAVSALAARADAQRRTWRRRRLSWAPESVPLAMHRPVSAYRADSIAPTVSMNLSRAMKCAGITRAGVRPKSCREYAANAVYAMTGRVEDVARSLGIGSLDAAYRLLDWEWQHRWAGADGLVDERLG